MTNEKKIGLSIILRAKTFPTFPTLPPSPPPRLMVPMFASTLTLRAFPQEAAVEHDTAGAEHPRLPIGRSEGRLGDRDRCAGCGASMVTAERMGNGLLRTSGNTRVTG
jgi:hypothetical protein